MIGLVLGLVNGVLVAWGRVPAVIATLGTLTVYRGLVFILSGGQQVDPQDIPGVWSTVARPGVLGVPLMVLLAVAVAAAAGLFLRYGRTGRAMYAVGSDPAAARLRGMDADRVILIAYLVTGALSGLAGVLYAARFATVNPASAGTGFELQVIAATVIGGRRPRGPGRHRRHGAGRPLSGDGRERPRRGGRLGLLATGGGRFRRCGRGSVLDAGGAPAALTGGRGRESPPRAAVDSGQCHGAPSFRLVARESCPGNCASRLTSCRSKTSLT